MPDEYYNDYINTKELLKKIYYQSEYKIKCNPLYKIQEQQVMSYLSKHTLKFTRNNVGNDIYLHSKEVKDMFRSHPNAIVDNGIVYIDNNNIII
jgi:hypothetical protein